MLVVGVFWDEPGGRYPRDLINIEPVFFRVIFKGFSV